MATPCSRQPTQGACTPECTSTGSYGPRSMASRACSGASLLLLPCLIALTPLPLPAYAMPPAVLSRCVCRMSNPAMNRKIVMVSDPTLAGAAFARMPKDPCYKNFQCVSAFCEISDARQPLSSAPEAVRCCKSCCVLAFMQSSVQILSRGKGGFDVFSHAIEDATWRAARKYIAPFFTTANIRCAVHAMSGPHACST